jgi:hypothetical protein
MNVNHMIVASSISFAKNTAPVSLVREFGVDCFGGNMSAKLISEKGLGGSTKSVKGR